MRRWDSAATSMLRGTVSATDALSVLKAAVGIPRQITCNCTEETPSVPLTTGQTACYD